MKKVLIFTLFFIFLTPILADYEWVKTYSSKKRKLYLIRDKKKAKLVDIKDYIPDAIIDMKYATKDSMFKKPVYKIQRCLVKKELAEKLKKIDDKLRKKHKLRIKFWDCYRPWHVQKLMWKLYPKRGYVAHPAWGSNHNRGCAVDVTLTYLEGKEIEMPTKFDDLSKKANHTYYKLSKKVIKNRKLLKKVMIEGGLKSIRSEWWHYNLAKPKRYPVLDVPLKD